MPRLRSHLSNFMPQRSAARFDDPDMDAFARSVDERFEALSAKFASLVGPGQRPTGPRDVTAVVRHKTVILFFRPDTADVSVRAYRIWRAPAGDTGTPIVPTAINASQIGTIAPTWAGYSPFEVFSFIDADFTDAELTAPESMFMYWITTLNLRGEESPPVPIAGGPVAVVA